jgi:hypothetical protein
MLIIPATLGYEFMETYIHTLVPDLAPAYTYAMAFTYWALTLTLYVLCLFCAAACSSKAAISAFEMFISSQPCIAADKNVSLFRQIHVDRPFSIDEHKLNVSNVHPHAAKRRSAARHWIDCAIIADGRTNYALNCSNSDLLKGADGSRKLRTPKDFAYYRQTREDEPLRRHHFSAVDDLDWYSTSQFSELLATSLHNDSTIYSYMHTPTSASFTTDEFSVNFDAANNLWNFCCADEETYDQELWDNTKSITSHYSFGKITWRYFAIILLIATIVAYAVLLHCLDDGVFHIVIPYGHHCYSWFQVHVPTLIPFTAPPPYVFFLEYNEHVHEISLPSIWALLPAKALWAPSWTVVDYPWSVECPSAYIPYVNAVTSFCITFIFLILLKMLAGLQSGFHFNFHISCGESRTIWVCHPAVKFGLLHTLRYAFEIRQLLPQRIRPCVIKTPASDLEPDGAIIYAFSHIDQETSSRLYTYNIANTARSTVFDEKAYNVIKAHNLSNTKKMPVASFQIAYGPEFRDRWSTDQIIVGINAVTYERGHTRVTEYVRPPTVTNYRFRVEDYQEKEKISVLSAFFDGATRGCTYIPQDARGNTLHGIQTRITDVRPLHLDADLGRYKERNIVAFLNEYKREICNNKVQLLSAADVYERQSKPSQRLSNNEAMGFRLSDWLVYARALGKLTQSFQKTEAGMKPGDPRNITPMPAPVRLQNSRISLALADNMKRTTWYSFGLTPSEVANRVAEHVSDNRTNEIALGDYSRMDGTINHLIRKFDVAFLLSNFEPADHAEIITWYELTYGNRVRAGHGVSYEQGFSQASGDPYTSALNTARNAFISFCCLLASPIDGSAARISERGAYANLGLMAGDDSIQRNISEKHSVKTAASWGFVLKFVMRKRGDPVDYLARQYSPAVWNGHPDNVCSPLRAISKFHVSTLNSIVPRNVIAFTKAASILTNDALTLLVGDWMRMIMRQTEQDYLAWCKGASKSKLALLDATRPWNDKWAREGNISETSYQSGNTLDIDWQMALFLKEFDYEKIEAFQLFLADPTSLWDQCPNLAEHDAKPAAIQYLADGVFVDPSDHDECKHDHESDEEPPPLTPITPKPPTTSKKPPGPKQPPPTPKPSDKTACRRGDNVTGWYKGLQPCTNTVTKPGFCKACWAVYKSAKLAPASVATHGQVAALS